MKQFNLSDYLDLSQGKILKVKLKNNNEFIYGRIASAGMLTKPTEEVIINRGVFGQLNKINNLENYKKDKSAYKDFTLISLSSSDIEAIEIIIIYLAPLDISNKNSEWLSPICNRAPLTPDL